MTTLQVRDTLPMTTNPRLLMRSLIVADNGVNQMHRWQSVVSTAWILRHEFERLLADASCALNR